MYTPHTVTVFNTFAEHTAAAVLHGVFLEVSSGADLTKTGASGSCAATLYIPFSCKAADAVTGQALEYVPPKQYEHSEDRSACWTIGPRDLGSGADCFFVKGEITETNLDYAGMRSRYDYVYRVKTVDVLDFGSPELQHLEVGGV